MLINDFVVVVRLIKLIMPICSKTQYQCTPPSLSNLAPNPLNRHNRQGRVLWVEVWIQNKNAPKGAYSLNCLAEREGFEPSVQVNLYAGFRIRCIRPLCHLSGSCWCADILSAHLFFTAWQAVRRQPPAAIQAWSAWKPMHRWSCAVHASV